MPPRLITLACAALPVALAAAAAAASSPPRTERVSARSHGGQTQRSSYGPSLSSSGRYVAFMSYDHKLVRHDTNNDADIFVRDRSTGTTKRVSVGSHGRQSNGRSEWADISASGRFVAFESRGSNLASGDRNKRYDVFVRDLKRNRTTLAGIAPNGIHGGATPSLSADGRFVAFGGLDKNGATGQIFVRDLKEHSTQRVTVSMAGGRPDGGSFAPSISGNGRLVAFSSGADDLVAGDTNGAVDIFVRDLKTHETEMVSVSPPPHEEGGFSDGASISADGRYVAFQSSFDPNTGNPSGGVFRRDLETKTTERISVGEGGEPENAASFAPAISASGRYVAFTSFASNLVPGDTNEQSGVAVRDIFVRDAVTKTTTRVSVSSSGEQSNSQSQAAAISGDGRFAAFQSQATNLDGDTKGKWNIFVRGPLRP